MGIQIERDFPMTDLSTQTYSNPAFLEYVRMSHKATDAETPLQYFQLFFMLAVVEKIAVQTNLYYRYLCKQSNKQLPTFEDTNSQEILAFLAMIAMGIAKPAAIDDYW